MSKKKKSFYAYMSRLKHIKRWGLMRNTMDENVAEHSFDVVLIAHALCAIASSVYEKELPEKEVVLRALYHETSEAITGDLPTPVKYFSEDLTQSYKEIERHAEQRMISMLPPEMRKGIEKYVTGDVSDEALRTVKAADTICAYIKCLEEKKSGNTEFVKAEGNLLKRIEAMDLPEVDYFMEHFIKGYMLTLDELNG